MDEYRVPLRFRISRPILKTVFRGLFHILGRVAITGREHIPLGQPYVVAINHVSIFDPPFAGAFWPDVLEIIGAADVFDKPGQGQVLKLYGVTPVHRGEYDRALLDWVVRVIKSGRPLLIAPEGGRSHVPAMQRARPGIGYIIGWHDGRLLATCPPRGPSVVGDAHWQTVPPAADRGCFTGRGAARGASA
jgi:1-acyl-sn-glycerol-3-phosphate acyltransferase